MSHSHPSSEPSRKKKEDKAGKTPKTGRKQTRPSQREEAPFLSPQESAGEYSHGESVKTDQQDHITADRQ